MIIAEFYIVYYCFQHPSYKFLASPPPKPKLLEAKPYGRKGTCSLFESEGFLLEDIGGIEFPSWKRNPRNSSTLQNPLNVFEGDTSWIIHLKHIAQGNDQELRKSYWD